MEVKTGRTPEAPYDSHIFQLAVYWVRVNKPVGIVLSIWTSLIVASTLLIKQHYIADMIFGPALAFGAALVYLKVIAGRNS